MNQDELLVFVDAILKAGGSSIRYYTLPGSVDKMANAARNFESAIRADQREKDAKVCEEWRAGCDNRSMQAEGWAAAECAAAIRAGREE